MTLSYIEFIIVIVVSILFIYLNSFLYALNLFLGLCGSGCTFVLGIYLLSIPYKGEKDE